MAGDDSTSSSTPGPLPVAAGAPVIPPEELPPRAWEALGLERDQAGLAALLADLARDRPAPAAVRSRAEAEACNLADVALAMAVSALFPADSPGGHRRPRLPATTLVLTT